MKKANIIRECIHQLTRQTIGLKPVSPKRYVIMSMDINRATKPEVGEIFPSVFGLEIKRLYVNDQIPIRTNM